MSGKTDSLHKPTAAHAEKLVSWSESVWVKSRDNDECTLSIDSGARGSTVGLEDKSILRKYFYYIEVVSLPALSCKGPI